MQNLSRMSKRNKKIIRRERKNPLPKAFVKKIEKATLGYGRLKDLSIKAELDYNTIHAAKLSGKATDKVRRKLETALNAA